MSKRRRNEWHRRPRVSKFASRYRRRLRLVSSSCRRRAGRRVGRRLSSEKRATMGESECVRKHKSHPSKRRTTVDISLRVDAFFSTSPPYVVCPLSRWQTCVAHKQTAGKNAARRFHSATAIAIYPFSGPFYHHPSHNNNV